MKKLLVLLVLFVFVACDKEKVEILDDQPQNTLNSADPKENGEGEKDKDKGKEIELKDIPVDIKNDISKRHPKHKFIGAEMFEEDGKKIYAITLEIEGEKVTMYYSADGDFLGYKKEKGKEKGIELNDLPVDIQKDIFSKHPKHKFLGAEKIEKDGKSYFIITLNVDGKTFEMYYDINGKFIGYGKGEKEKGKDGKYRITQKELMHDIILDLKKRHPKHIFVEAYKIVKEGEVFFVITIKEKDVVYHIKYDAKGKFLGEEKIK